MLKVLQKLLLITLLVILGLFLSLQGFLYYQARDKMPVGMTVAGIDVQGMTPEEVAEQLTNAYLAPITVHHQEESIEVLPADLGFTLDLETMLREANEAREPATWWQGYLEFVVGRALEPVAIELHATHDREVLRQRLQMLADLMDQPATAPHLVEETASYTMGKPGFVADVQASYPLLEEALYRLDNREAELVIVEQEAIPFDMDVLRESIERETQAFHGLGSFFIMDLATGEELGINADVALSGLSVVKIAILLETYRALDAEPTADQQKLIDETAIQSGNYSANLLLDIVAGQDNAYLGVDILTESMQRLGLENTFIVTPYEEPNRPGRVTQATPANMRGDISTNPDPTMQTTAEDMGTLLSMIYYCANGGGTLLAVYPEQVTPDECQAILDALAKNVEGNLIRFGIPEGQKVSHKHGWAGNTHGDAGVVFSPAGDYVIVEYLTDPSSDWLVHDLSFPILREVSREVYNYFNFEDPYLDLPEALRAETPEAEEESAPEAPGDGQEAPSEPGNDGELPPGIEALRRARMV